MKCINCEKNVECVMCDVQERGVLVPPHTCPNAHEGCDELSEVKTKHSKNLRAKKIAGIRDIGKCTIIIDQPYELGYHCPVCEYENCRDGNYDERLEWSEYNGFIWCSACNKDYPSCLSMPDIDKAIDIYLTCLDEN
jgi:hypothetical protein